MAAPPAVTNATCASSKKSHKCVIDVTDNPSSSRLRAGSKSRAAARSWGTTGLSQATAAKGCQASKMFAGAQREQLGWLARALV